MTSIVIEISHLNEPHKSIGPDSCDKKSKEASSSLMLQIHTHKAHPIWLEVHSRVSDSLVNFDDSCKQLKAEL